MIETPLRYSYEGVKKAKMNEQEINPEVELSPEEERLAHISQKSQKGDVTYDLNRYFRQRLEAGDPKLLEIQKQGYLTEAKKWLESTTAEGMKYGQATKEQRFEQARKYAELAGLTTDEIRDIT